MTVLPINPSAPKTPICRSTTDPTQPCRFASLCHEARQRTQSCLVKRVGQDVQIGEPMWGPMCWFYGKMEGRLGTEEQQERQAIARQDDPI